ncbi:MAG: hypothetical protein KF861_11955 [Planctomycetaceae bacterium]|nr:hypothetical protein [Planctomycetaceae bacterium]
MSQHASGFTARGPLVDWHRRAGATVDRLGCWEVALSYPVEPLHEGGSALVDITGRTVHELGGRNLSAELASLTGGEHPIRAIRAEAESGAAIYRLTDVRAIRFCDENFPIGLPAKAPPPTSNPEAAAPSSAIDVTGGWASLGLAGPHAREILQKVTALDLRDQTLPVGTCCQGPIFGVNTLFGRFATHYELHACPDMTEFLWEVLLDAGAEFDLRPAGLGWWRGIASLKI